MLGACVVGPDAEAVASAAALFHCRCSPEVEEGGRQAGRQRCPGGIARSGVSRLLEEAAGAGSSASCLSVGTGCGEAALFVFRSRSRGRAQRRRDALGYPLSWLNQIPGGCPAGSTTAGKISSGLPLMNA